MEGSIDNRSSQPPTKEIETLGRVQQQIRDEDLRFLFRCVVGLDLLICCVKLPEGDWDCELRELSIGDLLVAKCSLDKLAETYDKIDGSVIFNLHYKINTISQNGSKLSDYYHKLSSLWREYDAMVQLPVCTYDRASSYKDHIQLLKLMQFVMGLDDVYAPIRSTLSDNKGNTSSFTNRPMDNKKKFNNVRNPNLVCTNCNLTGHIIERCFELIGYPPNFKKKSNISQNVSNVSVTSKSADASGSVSHTLTSNQYQKRMSLLSDSGPSSTSQSNMAGWIIDYGASQHMTFTTTFLFNIIDVSHMDITVAHPNGTKAKVNQIRSCKLNDNLVIHDVLVVLGYHVSLLSVSKLAKDNKLSVCFNENDCVIQDSILKSQV
ncbi:hypothetical protein Tco_1310082 [Tanacetum coccineum]